MTNEPSPEGDDDLPDVAVVCEAPSHEIHVIRVLYPGKPSMRVPGTELIHRLTDDIAVDATAASSITMAVGGGNDASLRGRWPFECSLCGDRVEVRGERLWPFIDTLARHGRTCITLSGLRYMLRP